MNASLIGAPSAIIIDGINERESGVTPPPPAITITAIAIAIAAMFILGLTMFAIRGFVTRRDPIPVGWHEGLWVTIESDAVIDSDTRFEFMTEPNEIGEVTVWVAYPDANTTCLVDGRRVTAEEFRVVLEGPDGVTIETRITEEGTIAHVNAKVLGITDG
ncbi:MAG: hypothetical protein ACYCX5_09865 [Coriobacteriia bacterium]